MERFVDYVWVELPFKAKISTFGAATRRQGVGEQLPRPLRPTMAWVPGLATVAVCASLFISFSWPAQIYSFSGLAHVSKKRAWCHEARNRVVH